MKKIIILISLIIVINIVKGQNEPLIFSKILKLDSISKNEIFDKTLIWCSKSFSDSKSAINVKEREGGIIVGKARVISSYKIPKRKDSILSMTFLNYYFDWLIEIKEGRLRFTANNIFLNDLGDEILVTNSTKAPYQVWLQPTSKTELEWKLSKENFINYLDRILESLKNEILFKNSDW